MFEEGLARVMKDWRVIVDLTVIVVRRRVGPGAIDFKAVDLGATI